jgi:hypothetical protein
VLYPAVAQRHLEADDAIVRDGFGWIDTEACSSVSILVDSRNAGFLTRTCFEGLHTQGCCPAGGVTFSQLPAEHPERFARGQDAHNSKDRFRQNVKERKLLPEGFVETSRNDKCFDIGSTASVGKL